MVESTRCGNDPCVDCKGFVKADQPTIGQTFQNKVSLHPNEDDIRLAYTQRHFVITFIDTAVNDSVQETLLATIPERARTRSDI